MPAIWWEDFCRKSNGYFGLEEADPDSSQLDKGGVSTWCRFLVKRMRDTGGVNEDLGNAEKDVKPYYWAKLNVFSRWYRSANQTTILVLNPGKLHDSNHDDSEKVLDDFMSWLTHDIRDGELADPFWIYPRLVEVVVKIQDKAVWEIRDCTRHTELTRPGPKSKVHDPRVLSFPELYEVQRQTVHVDETLRVAVTTLEWIEKCHQSFLQGQNTQVLTVSRNITSRLLFYHHMLLSFLRRSGSNKTRMNSEIGLDFNTVAQCDSSTSVEISKSAQQDNATMRTIALVSLLFLPSTFVSALFSTSFFAFDGNSGSGTVSHMIWVYWAVAAALTIIAVTIWLLAGRPKKKVSIEP